MCTVTFIPFGDSVFITSNRDEKNSRKTALPPAIFQINTGNVLMPRDPYAGGTWLAVHENGNAIVLLNGAFIRHESNPPYKKSRGLILLDMLDSYSIIDAFNDLDLENIEPFTAIILNDGSLYECRWDGAKKHCLKKNSSISHIWSSSTLYDEANSAKREFWFKKWVSTKSIFDLEAIIHFHKSSGDGDRRNDLVMDRDGIVSTVCISGIQINNSEGIMTHLDIKQNQTWKEKIIFTKAAVTNS